MHSTCRTPLSRRAAASLRRAAAGVIGHPRKRRRQYHATALLSKNNGATSFPPHTDGGTVEAVFLFHRHGDRAPNRYLGDGQFLEAEADHWRGRIPSKSAHEGLSRFFPPDVHESQNGGKYMDVGREPFGFLTYRGMDQMRTAGQSFRRRYERFGRRLDGDGASASRDASVEDQGGGYSLLDHWDVRAYSTNYLRTVMSVQCFLDGLIGTEPGNNTVHGRRRIRAGGGLERYYKDVGKQERWSHLDTPTWTNDADLANADEGIVKVQVRDREIDTLNAFDRHPQMMNDLVKDVIATESFQRIDGNAKDLADTLATYLPGLRGAPQAFGGTPSGINWVHANDHFVCRSSHSVPLLAFSDHEGKQSEKEVEAALAALAALAVPVCSHLAWRFREWYKNRRLLSAIAVPPFREMMGIMRDVANSSGVGERRPFVLYSCHDVTLLAFLYAIGADFLVSGEDCGGAGMRQEGVTSNAHFGMNRGSIGSGSQQTSWRWWPAYSSTIAFELVRMDSAASGRDEQHVIRVILNGKSVRLIPRMSQQDEGLLKDQSMGSRQIFGTGMSLLGLSDFERVISVLESCGNFSPVEEENVDLSKMDKIGVDGG